MRLKGLVKKQAELMLGSQQLAVLYAVVLAILPYTAWLAMTVIALVTLRKGERAGGTVLLAAMAAHGLIALTAEPMLVGVVNTIIFFVPCYLAACTLRMTSNWQAVAALLFLLVILSGLLIQAIVPEWIMSQYAIVQSLLKTAQPDHVLSKWLNESSAVPDMVMANYVFGMQLMSAVISVLVALTMARSLQSQLYYPGGFLQELLGFRGNRLSCIVMLLLFVAAWQLNMVAINVIPVLALFFVMAGLSFCANLIIGKAPGLVLVLLILPLIFIPFVMLPLYIMLGLLDSVFNLRLVFCR